MYIKKATLKNVISALLDLNSLDYMLRLLCTPLGVGQIETEAMPGLPEVWPKDHSAQQRDNHVLLGHVAELRRTSACWWQGLLRYGSDWL